MSDHHIRLATPEDASIIAKLHVLSKQEGYKDFGNAEYLDALNAEDLTRDWHKWLSSNTNALIAFDAQDNAAGFIAFGAIRTRIKEDRGIMPAWPGEIYALYVAPDFWGKGIAQGLMHEAAPHLRKAYQDKCLLWVIEKNKRAIKFYQKMGGTRVGKQSADIDGTNLNELAFGWKDITKLPQG